MSEEVRALGALMLIAWTLAGLLRRSHPGLRLATGLAGVLWMSTGIVIVDVAAHHHGWWTYVGDAPRVLHSPIDILIAWSVIWGAAPLAAAHIPKPMPTVAIFALADLILMPRLPGLVTLGPDWWLGEIVLLALVAGPGVILVHSMRTRTRLAMRTSMLVALFTVFTLGFVLVVGTGLTGEYPVAPSAKAAFVWLQVIGLLAVPGVRAVYELYLAGGTPYPWDPPARVVSTGPYAYVRNPMQVSMTLTLLGLAVALRHWPTLLASVVAITFVAGIAEPHEQRHLAARWRSDWTRYSATHRAWLPKLRPDFGEREPAVLYLDGGCVTCQTLGRWITARDPVGLIVADARDLPGPALWRAAYVREGTSESGVAAIAAAMEHTNLGLAMVGWTLRFPGIRLVAQAISDGLIMAPHPAVRSDRHPHRPGSAVRP